MSILVGEPGFEPGPPGPKPGALPNCATPRKYYLSALAIACNLAYIWLSQYLLKYIEHLNLLTKAPYLHLLQMTQQLYQHFVLFQHAFHSISNFLISYLPRYAKRLRNVIWTQKVHLFLQPPLFHQDYLTF